MGLIREWLYRRRIKELEDELSHTYARLYGEVIRRMQQTDEYREALLEMPTDEFIEQCASRAEDSARKIGATEDVVKAIGEYQRSGSQLSIEKFREEILGRKEH